MRCTCQSSVRAEREAICNDLEMRGQKWLADKYRNGEHLKLRVVATGRAPSPRGMEDDRGWEDGA